VGGQTNKQPSLSKELYLMPYSQALLFLEKKYPELPIAGGRTVFVKNFSSEKLPDFG
jgi:hypothetical protein